MSTLQNSSNASVGRHRPMSWGSNKGSSIHPLHRHCLPTTQFHGIPLSFSDASLSPPHPQLNTDNAPHHLIEPPTIQHPLHSAPANYLCEFYFTMLTSPEYANYDQELWRDELLKLPQTFCLQPQVRLEDNRTEWLPFTLSGQLFKWTGGGGGVHSCWCTLPIHHLRRYYCGLVAAAAGWLLRGGLITSQAFVSPQVIHWRSDLIVHFQLQSKGSMHLIMEGNGLRTWKLSSPSPSTMSDGD